MLTVCWLLAARVAAPSDPRVAGGQQQHGGAAGGAGRVGHAAHAGEAHLPLGGPSPAPGDAPGQGLRRPGPPQGLPGRPQGEFYFKDDIYLRIWTRICQIRLPTYIHRRVAPISIFKNPCSLSFDVEIRT